MHRVALSGELVLAVYFACAASIALHVRMSRRQSFLLLVGALVAVLLVYWQVSNVVRINALLVTIDQKQRQLDSLSLHTRQEQILIARLESAERIRRIGRQIFGLQEPAHPPIIVRSQ